MKSLKKISVFILVGVISISLYGCSSDKKENKNAEDLIKINKNASDLVDRYEVPHGYKRVDAEKDSFAEYIRHEKLKNYGEKSLYYNGKEKDSEGVYDSVFDVDLENRDLLHCADMCFKFRGDYLYSTGQYSKIKFHFVSNGIADFSKYAEGYRVNPDTGEYYMSTNPSTSEETYKKFMNLVYAYSGTLSLEKDTHKINVDQMQIGDMFVRGGTPGTKRVGHAIMVVDMAVDNSGQKVFMLAQSYMPAQQPQILINKNNKKISPWYSIEEVKKYGELKTPQWTFTLDEFKRFSDI
ncbi:DUF4846 domain-containing protein [Peptostreptococcus faecalis]|uniref:DUF4846 domain-containing protein n=1 Tax=Peptostreptococcus faecalis TaxID=2045015 RepID=UPI000C7CA794|nr:DUF4846 domain-containing protein [Peptostreptococcus faecalis]